MRRTRVLSTAAISVAAVLTLSGCNGGNEATQVDGLSPVAAIQKVADTARTDSATYTFALAGNNVSVKGSGAYRGGSNPAAQLTFDALKVAGLSVPAGTEFRIVDQVLYLKSSKNGMIPGVADGGWVKVPLDDVKANGNSVGGLDLSMTNPADELKKMLDTQDVTKVGTEAVDGVSTTHYRANVDSTGGGTVTEKKTESSNELSRELEQQLSDSIKSKLGVDKPVTVDAWVDGEYHARKLMVTLPFLGEMTLTMKFADFGSDVNVPAPADAKAFDLKDALGGQLGDALGQDFGDFGNFNSGSGSSSADAPDFSQLQKQIQAEVDKRLKDAGVSS